MRRIHLLVLCFLVVSDAKRSRIPSAENQNESNDIGKVQNCGDKEHDFSLKFSPTTLQVGTNMTVWLDMVPATGMSSGTLSVTLTVPGVPDPIYKQQLEFDCSQINPYVPGVCPFKAKVPLKGKWVFQIPTKAHTVEIPTGEYHVKAEVKNEYTDLFICGKTKLKIINPQ